MTQAEQISQAIATVERQISEAKSDTAKKVLAKKLERLKEDLKKAKPSLTTLPKARKTVKALNKSAFQELVEELSKKPEYAFLKNYSQERFLRDKARTAKPKGYRFKGDNDNIPTADQVKKGLKNGTVYYEGRPIRSDISREIRLKTGGKVSDVNIKSLEGHWNSYNKGVMSGKKDEGYVTIKNEEDLKDYITKKIGSVVKDIKVLEKGKSYPYNRSNPYFEDTYLVTLKNGSTFEVERSYGRPNWSGNVDYKEQISIKNRNNKYATGGGVEKGYNNPEKATHVLNIDGFNWYLEKIDSTHFYMSNDPNSRGMAHHVDQHRGEPYYEEVRSWLKSTKFATGGNVQFRKLAKSNNFDIVVSEGRFEVELDSNNKVKSIVHPSGERHKASECPIYQKYKKEINEYLTERFADGGSVGTQKKYEIELFFTGLSGADRKLGKYVVSEKTLDKLEEEYSGNIDFDVLDETDSKAQTFDAVNKDVIAKANEKFGGNFFKNGGSLDKDGAEKGYNVFNYTDNIYATDEVFKTKKSANDFIKEFRNRFSKQGYYRDNQMNKIDIEDIDLLAIPVDFSPFRKFGKGGGVGSMDVEIQGFKRNRMGTLSFDLKLSNMRKFQDFIVYPVQKGDDNIKIQSDTRIGRIYMSSGKGEMSQSHSSGAYGVHLAMDKLVPFQLSSEQLEELKSSLRATAGDKVGDYGIVSDNSGADQFANGGEIKELIEEIRFVEKDDTWGSQTEKDEYIKELYNEIDRIKGKAKLNVSKGDRIKTINGEVFYVENPNYSEDYMWVTINKNEKFGYSLPKVDVVDVVSSPNKKFAKGGMLSAEEEKRFQELEEKIDLHLEGKAKVSSKEMVEHAKLKHKKNVATNPEYRKQMNKFRYAEGGNIDSSYLGTTRIGKGHYGWTAKTTTKKQINGYDWEITTMKRSSGDLVSSANGGKSEQKEGYSTFMYSPFEDPSLRLISSKPKMVNEKAVTKQHEEALKIFIEKLNEMKGDKMATGGKAGDGDKFTYMMLGRLQMDNDYYLGHGNRSEKVLWAGGVEEQIKEMKRLWNSLPKDGKPEWLSMEDIKEYEKQMKGDKMAHGGKVGEKTYNIMHNVGKSKYVVNFHDGEKTHSDGSPFFDIEIFKNLKGLKAFTKKLDSEGYKKQMKYGGKTKSQSTKSIYIETIAGKTGLRTEAIETFVSENNLSDKELLNLVQGIGTRKLDSNDLISAVVGIKGNKKISGVVAFAKSDKAFSKMATGGIIESFVLQHNALNRKEMMSIGLSKGDLMKMAYGDNLTNVDSALPMGLLEELGISNDERYHYVMDYQNNSFGKLTDLFEKIEARNPKVEIFNTDYEELDVLPILEASKKYKNKEVFFQYREESSKMATGGGVKASEFETKGNTIYINGTKADVKKMYLDYVNNFLTIGSFADHYGISDKQASLIIENGREYAKKDGYYATGGSVGYDADISATKEVIKAFFDKYGDALGLTETEAINKIEAQEYLGRGASSFNFLSVSSNIGDKLKQDQTKPNRGYLIFGSDINPNGVTGKGDIARTYTIDLEIKGRKRISLRSYDNDGRYFKVYAYGRTVDELLDKISTPMLQLLKGMVEKDGLKFSSVKAEGGNIPKVKVGEIITTNTGVKVKVVAYDPLFGGRIKAVRMDEYGDGKESQWIPIKKFKYKDGGNVGKYIYIPNDDISKIVLKSKQVISKNRILDGAYVKGGKQKEKFTDKYKFPIGSVVWDKTHKRYGVVLNNYGDEVFGSHDEIRLDSDGNQNIHTYDKKWNNNGYNLVPYGSEEDKGDGDLTDNKWGAVRIIELYSKSKINAENKKYYEDAYKDLLSGKIDGKPFKVNSEKVIGETSTGKSIYQKYTSMPDLSYEELKEASDIHKKFSKKAKTEEEKQTALRYSSEFMRMANEEKFAKGLGKFATGGNIDKDRLFNFLKDDLEKLKEAINDNDQEEIDKFFSYWNRHLKGLRSESNERMYNFLKDDLEELKEDIEENDQEDIDKFFSYWGQHLEAVKFATGGKITKEDALQEAIAMGVDFDKEFHAQSFGNELTELAKKVGYRKAPSSSGSTGRAFFYHLQKIYDKKKFATGGSVSQYIDGMTEAEILKATIVYDNGGETLDRYTVFAPDGSVYGMSDTASGFNQYVGDDSEIEKGSHLGKRLKTVPKGIKSAVLDRMKEEFADGGMMYAGGGNTSEDLSGNYFSSTDFVETHELTELAKETFGDDWESGGDYDYDIEEIRLLIKKLGGGYKVLYFDSENRDKFEEAKSKYFPLISNKSNDGDLFVIPTTSKKARGGNTNYSYIEKDKIDRIVTNSGKEYGSNVILDGAYVTDRVRTPKMSRTQFEDETYSYGNGGVIRKMYVGDAVLYKDEVWYVTEKGGELGIVYSGSGAWGLNAPFVPLSRIDMSQLTDMMGRKVEISKVTYHAKGGNMQDFEPKSEDMRATILSIQRQRVIPFDVSPDYAKFVAEEIGRTITDKEAIRIAKGFGYEGKYATGGNINFEKHIWEGWTVGDFIQDLEISFNQIMSGGSWQKPFTTKQQVKEWCMDNQSYYKKHIPEVVNYFWAKVEGKFATGGTVGDYFYDTRKDKAFRVIMEDGDKMAIQYLDRSKSPIGKAETISKNEFEYYVQMGAWNKWKQEYATGGEITPEEREQGLKNYPKLNF